MNSDQKNKDLCKNCDACCRYIALEIDRPTTKDEEENIIWFLLHKNVTVYIGLDNKWYIEFQTPCKALKKGLCQEYQTRPKICREFTQDSCVKYNPGPTEKILFSSAEDFKKYLVQKKPAKKK